MARGSSGQGSRISKTKGVPRRRRAASAGTATVSGVEEATTRSQGRDSASAEAAAAYSSERLSFGPEYLIPKPFDPRLMIRIAPAVAKAAADSGVALRPIQDYDAYREKLQSFVYASGTTMKPIFAVAKRAAHKRVVYCEGEEERVLRASAAAIGLLEVELPEPTDPEPPSVTGLAPAAKREVILTEAIELFAARGFRDVGMAVATIAAAVGAAVLESRRPDSHVRRIARF